ncbi:hypothetical protein ABZX40_22165 [Streptomyces sp. NPDC004610]|uniref:hypothetical protein n=1 Tax=unclassified Streptomyces TaxID=2593676 RepID=UPI0033B22F3F
MADEHHRWLDRETAERLLRGEPLEALDDDARDQADRLAQALGALSVPPPPPTGEELPGEAAALAAFRKVRADPGEADCPFTGDLSTPRASDAGLIRIGGHGSGRAPRRAARAGPFRGRQLRLGLAAALAVVMIGGIAAATGTGVLPTPFDDEVPPGPAASAPVRPPTGTSGPSPAPGQGDAEDGAAPGGALVGGSTPTPSADAPTPSTPVQPSAPSTAAWKDAVKACRDLSKGKSLTDDRRRALEDLAGGSARVADFCRVMTSTGGNGTASGKDKTTGPGTETQGEGQVEGSPTPKSGKSAKPAKSAKPTKSAKPAKPAKPVKSPKPSKSAKPPKSPKSPKTDGDDEEGQPAQGQWQGWGHGQWQGWGQGQDWGDGNAHGDGDGSGHGSGHGNGHDNGESNDQLPDHPPPTP